MSSNVLEKEITLTEILSFVDILKGVEPEFLFDRQMIPKLQVLPFLSNPKMNCSNRNKNNIIEKNKFKYSDSENIENGRNPFLFDHPVAI